jgi:radical SAM protein with 4Fe4S-binding SPASM domain
VSLLAAVSARGVRDSIPISVHVDLTMRCNEVCVHCYRVVEDRGELTLDELEHLFADLARLGTLYLTFSGGEVFLRPDLFEIIASAKRHRFDVRLKTNALLVTPAHARRLRELGVRQVDVSVYSADPAVHDGITEVPGSLARTLTGVGALRDAGLAVKLNCPMMTVNIDGYERVRALAEELGVPCGFDPMITARNDGGRGPVSLRVPGRRLLPLFQDNAVHTEAAACGDRAHPDDVPCGAGHVAGYVSAYGDVMPCVAMPIACGNIREQSFEEIWKASPRMRDVRSIRVRDLHTCSGCAAAQFCMRCPGQTFVETGDLRGPLAASCDHAAARAAAAGSTAVPATLVLK